MFPLDLKVNILLRIKLAKKPVVMATQFDKIYQIPKALLRIKKTIYSKPAAIKPAAAYLTSCKAAFLLISLSTGLFPLKLPE